MRRLFRYSLGSVLSSFLAHRSRSNLVESLNNDAVLGVSLKVHDLQMMFLSILLREVNGLEHVRFVGGGQSVANVVSKNLAVPVLAWGWLPCHLSKILSITLLPSELPSKLIHRSKRYLESVLVKGIDAYGGWWATGCFFGSDDGDGVRRIGRANLVLSDDPQVISCGGSQVENTSYVLLRSWHEYSVDIGFPRALADFVFDNVTFDRAVSIVRRCPRQLNRTSRFVQYFKAVWYFGNLCDQKFIIITDGCTKEMMDMLGLLEHRWEP